MATNEDHDELLPTQTAGYKAGNLKSVDEYKNLDANDESLNRWKASLGLANAEAAPPSGPKITVYTLFLTSPDLPSGKTISIDINNPQALAALQKNPIVIKEATDYNVGITFKVNHSIVTGIRYIQVVKRLGATVDKLEQMLGSYAPDKEGKPYTKNFEEEKSPSGMLARSGSYNVRSRVVDDDGNIYADFEWTFKLAKEW